MSIAHLSAPPKAIKQQRPLDSKAAASPRLALVEELVDREIEDLARQRLNRKDSAIEVDIESL